MKVIVPLLAAIVCAAPLSALSGDTPLDQGYRQMYNLDFDGAHQTFQKWHQLHPDDPMGPVSDAAAYLFSEFERLKILQSELFINDDEFVSRRRPDPDPALKRAFDAALNQSTHLADRVLAKDPKNADAMFAKLLAMGLRQDYLALIEKKYFAALSLMKQGRHLAEKLLALQPNYYDAYLAIGMENYMLSLKPAPMRWLLKIGGAETDRSKGIAKLRLTAEKGRFLAPFARLLLAVAAARDKDYPRARELMAGLVRDFPRNRLYARELARLQ